MTDKPHHVVGDHPIVENPDRRTISRGNKDIRKEQKEAKESGAKETGSKQESSS